MSSMEERASTLLGRIVIDSPPIITFPQSMCLYETDAVNAIIKHLKVGDIDRAYRVYTHNGDTLRGVIYANLLYITNNGYGAYTLNVGIGFI